MHKVFLLLTLIFLLPVALLGQTRTVKTSLYFDNDKFELRPESKRTIDQTIDTLPQADIFKITVTGNTDNSADSLYNLKLSDNRTEAVKNYLTTKGIVANIISTKYLGEEHPIATNESDEGKQKNRRVDIAIFYKKKGIQQEILVDTIPLHVVKVDTCKGDTSIVLSQGTQLVFNRCEYLELKDCIEVTEMNNAQSIIANGFSLMDTSGAPISSCGMLCVKFKPGCTTKKCFSQPVKVRFPVPTNEDCDYCGKQAGLWNVNAEGLWVEVKGKKSEIKIIKVQGKMFYQFELACPGECNNCDCKIRGNKLKIKTRSSYKILSVKIMFDCPTVVYHLHPKRRKNIVKTKVGCWKGNKTIIATILNNQGDTLTLVQQPLNDLKKRTMFSRCHKIEDEYIGYKLGIFPIAKREVYRKYIIKPDQRTAE